MAASRSSVGGRPVAAIAASWVSLQLSLITVVKPLGPCSSRVGFAIAFGMPNRVSDGPRARSSTCLGPLPVMINPPMPTLSPVWTSILVEMLRACEAAPLGVDVAEAVAVALGPGVPDAVAVAVAVGVGGGVPDAVAVAVAVGVAVGVGVAQA